MFACDFLANVQDEPRPWLARAVLLGARIVTAMVVGSGALLGCFSAGPLCYVHYRSAGRTSFALFANDGAEIVIFPKLASPSSISRRNTFACSECHSTTLALNRAPNP